MNLVSVVGAIGSLECSILLMAAVLFLDFRDSQRRRRLVLSLKTTLLAAEPEPRKFSHPKAA